ncbi:MAG: hypothetical protein O2821_12155 [Chloroflexi bacterium]|nr:hypothetical protein [Chloroflexota bacterium]MDA1228780.1 hypothetical protein [Chloroflexota bacterium]
MAFELLVNLLARAALGIFSAIVLSFLTWRLAEASFDVRTLSLGWFFLVQAALVGVAAAVPTALAWWNTQSSRRIQLLLVVVTLGTAVVSAWLVNEIRGVETYYALFGGVRRVPVFSLSHMFVGMMFGAALGGNAVAAALYVYRVLRHRES